VSSFRSSRRVGREARPVSAQVIDEVLSTKDLDKVTRGSLSYTVRATDLESETVRLLTIPRGSPIEAVCDAYSRVTGEADLHFVFAVQSTATGGCRSPKIAARCTRHDMNLALDSTAGDPAGVADW